MRASVLLCRSTALSPLVLEMPIPLFYYGGATDLTIGCCGMDGATTNSNDDDGGSGFGFGAGAGSDTDNAGGDEEDAPDGASSENRTRRGPRIFGGGVARTGAITAAAGSWCCCNAACCSEARACAPAAGTTAIFFASLTTSLNTFNCEPPP